ncbi:MAG: hypothetical protein HC875_38720 [Anaerolineales bacterium]|nr:hypothetical protein [Anaerolineales bacterium]
MKGKEIAGKDVARIYYISGKENEFHNLQAGKDIREWQVGDEGVVNEIASYVNTAWRGQHAKWGTSAVIDYLVLEVPSKFQKHLDYLAIEDTSMEIFNSRNPGILIFGVFVEHF